MFLLSPTTFFHLLHFAAFCVTREYSMISHSYDEKLLDLRDARVHYYYSLLEQYMKHVFVAGLVTGFYEKTFEKCFGVCLTIFYGKEAFCDKN